jgi:hypothetical protein
VKNPPTLTASQATLFADWLRVCRVDMPSSAHVALTYADPHLYAIELDGTGYTPDPFTGAERAKAAQVLHLIEDKNRAAVTAALGL